MADVSTEDLDRLLQSANSGFDATSASDLIAGVIAAPGDDGGMGGPDDWLQLVASDMPDELAKNLRALSDKMQSELAPGATSLTASQRLLALRKELKERELDGFVVPLSDEHQGEYVPKRAQRLAWLTGFTGSAGVAVVLEDCAAIFVDGRYTLQVKEQVNTELFQDIHISDNPPDKWIAKKLADGARLGFDPWLHTVDGATRLRGACRRADAVLIATESNPVDAVWPDQPAPPLSMVLPLDIKYAGVSVKDKLAALGEQLAADGQDAVILTSPPSIAWLTNLRGGDVPYTPLPLSFAIAHQDGRLSLYIDQRKFSKAARESIDSSITLNSPDAFLSGLDSLGASGSKVRLDSGDAAEAIALRLREAGAEVISGEDPCVLPRACKNATELDGTRAAHRRDGVALTRFLAWLETAAQGGDLTEMEAADQLEKFRRENELIQGLSFPTISGSGPNGAIVHYRVTEASNRRIEPDSLFLVDSGAQYLDGTTDVTRTMAIGTPSEEMKDRFTRVLKGHIALATARFPAGTSGSQLDALARAPLWQAGLDYDHGTGHGVGSFLGVHEGPHRISKMPNRVGFRPGMIVSNEPGYYKTGAYGIRIENLVMVINIPAPEGAEREIFGFETLTLAPIDRKLILPDLLHAEEIDWLNEYHTRVREVIGPQLDAKTREWLEQVTAPF